MPADLVDATRHSDNPEKKTAPAHAQTPLLQAARHTMSSQDTPRHTTVVLTGFMGAGKSTVGRLLATQRDCGFLDLDQEIERATGQTVAALFAEHGEAAFREQEENMLQKLIEEHHGQRRPLVLALGGGALESARTRAYLAAREEILMVYLEAPLPLLIERCLAQSSAATRPLLVDQEQLTARWQRRLPHYEAAHLRIDTTNATPEIIAANLAIRIAKPFDPESK